MFKKFKKMFLFLPFSFMLFSFMGCTDSSSSSSATVDQPYVGKYSIVSMTTANIKDPSGNVNPIPQKFFDGTLEFSGNNAFTLQGTSTIKWPWQKELTPQEVNEKGTLSVTADKKDVLTFIGNSPEPGFTMSGEYKTYVFSDTKIAAEKRKNLPDNLGYLWLENKATGISILMIKTFFVDTMGL